MKKLMIGVSVALFGGLSGFADGTDDYSLAAGQSDTLSTNSIYATMNIAGDLRVDSNAIARFSKANLTGGTLTVDGAKSSFGCRKDNSAITLAHDDNGKYGKVTLQNGTNGGFSDPNYSGNTTFNLGTLGFTIASNSVENAGNDGYIDFLYMNKAGAHFKPLNNNSSLTGRVTIAGNSYMLRSWGYNYGGAIFNSGKFKVDLQNNSTLKFDWGNQQGSLVSREVKCLEFAGNGKVILAQQINDKYPITLHHGTMFNYTGELELAGDSGAGGIFCFYGDNIIGPNISRISSSTKYSIMIIYTGRMVELAGDFELGFDKNVLLGEGSLKLDCTAAPRTFKANAPKYCAVPTAGTITNFVQVIKTGANEAVFTSTNLVNLYVKEGAVRFVDKDCTIQRLQINEGAEVVVDGCTLTLDFPTYKRMNIRTVNGGKVVFAGEGAITCGSALSGNVLVKSGEVKFGGMGRTEKYWRFVFKGVDGTPQPVRIKNLYFFDADHNLQWTGNDCTYSYAGIIYDDNWTDLKELGVRWRISSATNIIDGGVSWCDIGHLNHLACTKYNGNNSPYLKSPLVNRDDPNSYIAFELRLKSNANPITGYNMLVSTDNAARPDTWDVYCSADGQEWTLVDSHEYYKSRPHFLATSIFGYEYSGYQTFDGTMYQGAIDVYSGSKYVKTYPGPAIQNKSTAVNSERICELFYLPPMTTSGLSATEPIQLQIDYGATLDLTAFTETAQTIDALTVDMTSGGGKVKGGVLAANGKVVLENINWDKQQPVPFEFDGTEGIANLANWPVVVNGVTLSGHMSYDSENKRLAFDGYLIHLTSSVEEGDLQGTYLTKDLNLKLDSGVVYTNITALTGDKGITLFGNGRLVLTKESDEYSGAIGLIGGVIEGVVSNAFGTGTMTIAGSTTANCMVKMGSATLNTAFDNDFVLVGDSSRAYPAMFFNTFKSRKQIVLNGSITANGALHIADNCCGECQGYYIVMVNGDVNASGQTITYSPDNFISWYGKVRAAKIASNDYSYPTMGSYRFYCSDNEIGEISIYYISCYACAENAWGGAKIRGFGGSNERGRGFFDMLGYNQTIVGLEWEASTIWRCYEKDIRNSNNNTPVTLTITGGVDVAKSYVLISGDAAKGAGRRLSVTLAAGNDNFVQELTNSVSTTYGNVIVSNGCLRLTGYSTMSNVPSIAVEGGSLELLSTKEGAFASATNVTVGAGATLKVAETAATPFGADHKSKAVLNVNTTGVLDLAEGATVEVRKAFVGGIRLDAGTYTGEEGIEGATVLPQIRGKGTLSVYTGGGLIFIVK